MYKSIVLVVLLVLYKQVYAQNCSAIRGDCSTCLQTTGCAYCASQLASGCFGAALGAYCPLFGGVTNNCDAKGTNCVQHTDCTSCQVDPGCSWCQTATSGYCFNSTGGNSLCSQLTGQWDACQTETSSSTTGSNEPIPANSNARCEDFSGSQCVGIVFYNVYANDSQTQTQMSAAVEAVAAFSGLPGVTNECRAAGALLNCGKYFQQCQTIPGTSIAVSVPICRSVCESYASACDAALRNAGVSVDCYVYPQDSVRYEHGGTMYEFPCNTMIMGDAGYYPNKLINGNFETLENDNETLKDWEHLGNFSNYRITLDSKNGTMSKVLEISYDDTWDSSPIGITQTIVLNRTAILPIRIRGLSKAVNIVGAQDIDYSIYFDLNYMDGSTERVTASFPTGSHDYTLQEAHYTPSKPIQNFTVTVALGKSGTAYFDDISFQEQVPSQQQASYICFPPLEFNPDWETSGKSSPCQLPCPPDQIWDDLTLHNNIRPVYNTLSYLGFFGTFFLVVTWLVFKEKRKYPDRLVLYFSICCMIISINGILQSTMSRSTLTCEDRFTYLQISNSFLCGFMGIILQFGAAGAIGWWLCIVLSTWVMIRYHMKQDNFARFERYFHIAVWSYATISTLIPLIAMEYKAGYAFSGCWVSDAHRSAFSLALFFVPEVIFTAIATVLIADCIRIIHKSESRSFKTYVRLILFASILYVNMILMFAYKFYNVDNQDQWEKDFAQEQVCRANGGTEEDCKITRINTSLYAMFCVGVGLQGILTFLFFGLTRRNYQLWKHLILKVPISKWSEGFSSGSKNTSKEMANVSGRVSEVSIH